MKTLQDLFTPDTITKAEANIKGWVDNRMFKGGAWAPDTLYCLSYGMENRTPVFGEHYRTRLESCEHLVILEWAVRYMQTVDGIPPHFDVFSSNMVEDIGSFSHISETAVILEYLRSFLIQHLGFSSPGSRKLLEDLERAIAERYLDLNKRTLGEIIC